MIKNLVKIGTTVAFSSGVAYVLYKKTEDIVDQDDSIPEKALEQTGRWGLTLTGAFATSVVTQIMLNTFLK